ncbi:3-deoxy-manno-octulosonate cytidylyltransferase [Roseimaritima ulvae]|uniref:3-deoxy-manno-octulosonate cytidylyltransferase n=1 Tax=Roseimaritima ulvae TaxID=980254 RepID=A0A5B9QW98_9BACT|nr:3-deoxy-manno-octulosonate cytidylyltransferase [Roseimaritima ulvae]QEG43314.1 3-deoxy-manno-octulosonate cytidylyltransferase [Roseimaritima ulvae]
MNTHVVIPARLASSRLPEKLLLRVDERSVLQHTHDAAQRAEGISGVTVAVDDPRLAQEVDGFGGRALMTSVDCQSGTDRIAEVAATMPEVDVFVNVQGDEPEIDPAAIELVSRLLVEHPEADMATVATPIRDPALWEDPNCVKVVMDAGGRALYFSRAAVPFVRDGGPPADFAAEPPMFWQHVGLYAYRRDFLLWFAAQPPAALEQLEKLEQLRALAAGRRIVVGRIDTVARGIDTLEDFEDFCQRFEN